MSVCAKPCDFRGPAVRHYPTVDNAVGERERHEILYRQIVRVNVFAARDPAQARSVSATAEYQLLRTDVLVDAQVGDPASAYETGNSGPIGFGEFPSEMLVACARSPSGRGIH